MKTKMYLRNKETGVLFNYNKHMAILSHMEEVSEADAFASEPNNKADEAKIDEPKDDEPVALEDMTWQAVKNIVEENGGEWTNKADGIEFLRVL